MNLPNKLTILRVILIPFFLVFLMVDGIPGGKWISLAIFIVASLTDMLDGKIARKYNLITTYGKFMDPIADKLLVNSSFTIMATQTPDMVPVIAVVIMIARDIVVDALRMISVQKGVVIAANIFGKLKTVTQMVAISLAFLDANYFMSFVCGGLTGFALILNILMSVAMILAVIATIWSGVDYFMKSKDVVLQSK